MEISVSASCGRSGTSAIGRSDEWENELVFGWFKKNGKTLTQTPASLSPDVGGATELSDAAHAKIKDLCARGDQQAAKREFDAAWSKADVKVSIDEM